MVERFSVFERAEHFLTIACIAVLLVTGIPQRFYDAHWAVNLLQMRGGLDSARGIHHVAGVVLALSVAGHLVRLFVKVGMGSLRLTLLPSPKDFNLMIANWRYLLGYTQNRPAFSKFNYRQKFEYLGLFMGGVVMVLSGVILLAGPNALKILPGHVIPAAREAHSNDGLVAFMMLLVWHLYSNLLAPGALPFNWSIFSGRMSKEELKRKHELEYGRIFGKK
jgi:formate dehydrogenase gamma subunit